MITQSTKKIKVQNHEIQKMKSRNFLTSISYIGVKDQDLWDRSFVFVLYVLATKNINPFSLERKFFDVRNREMINMFWKDSNNPSFYKYICKPDNFLYLNLKNVIYLRVADIVWKYLEQDEQNFNKIRKKLIENKKVFQFVYSSVYPEIYSFVEKGCIDLTKNFHLKFNEWKDKKKYSQKSIDGYFLKSEGSPPQLQVPREISLLPMKTLRGKKNDR